MKFIILLLFVISSGFVFSDAFADHSEVTIVPAAGSGAPGCEETSDGCYIPSTATVDVGGVVIMSNTDSAAHTYTSGTPGDGPDGIFDTGLLMAGGSYEYSPDTVGEIPYHCMVHPWMEGLIIVQSVEVEEEPHDDEHDDSTYTSNAEPDGTGMLSDETQVSIWTSIPTAGETMEIFIVFDAEHVNHDMTATQNGELILKDEFAHHHDGEGVHTTSPLSSSDPVLITVTFQGYGIDEPFTGPIGEEIIFSEYNQIPQPTPDPTPIPDIDDEVTIVPANGSGAPGCEETSDGCYIPSTAHIAHGGTVIFSNTDSAAHTFTAATLDDEITGEFDTGLLMAGQSFEYQTTEEGEITYLCMVHPWMRGLIVVGDSTIPTPEPTPEPEDDVWGELGTIYHRYDGPYDFIQTQVTSNIIRTDVNVEQVLNGEVVREYTTTTDHTGSFQFHRNITDDPRGVFEFRFLTTTNILLDSECYSWNGFDNPNNKAVDCDYSFSDPEEESEIISLSTRKSNYRTGDTIVISGKVSTTDFNIPVTLQVFNDGSLVDVAQVQIASDRSFSYTVLAEGSQWLESGKYTVKATFANDIEDTSFVFRTVDSKPKPIPIPDTDDEVTIVPANGSGAPGCEETSDGCYIPSVVSVSSGGVVIMKNTDTAAHTYTAGTPGDGPTGEFDTGLLMAGGSFEYSPDTEGAIPYFCMVHPWMEGLILVGEGTAPPPRPDPPSEDHIDLEITAENRVYDINSIAVLDIAVSGNSQAQNIAIEVIDPRGTTVISRSVMVDPDEGISFEFKIDESAKTGNYKVTATTSDGNRTVKDSTHFKVKSQYNSFKITSVEITDQKGYPSDLESGEIGFIKVNLESNKSIATLVTVNIFDSELTSIGIGSVQTTLASGNSEIILSFNIPDDAATGIAEIFVNAFSDWPSEGGVPLTGEASTTEDIS